MAIPLPYYFSLSSITLRLAVATMNRLSTAFTVVIGRLKLMMGTATGIALTYGMYKTVMGGQQPYIRTARGEAPPAFPEVPIPPFDQNPEDNSRHGLQPRPEVSNYLDLAKAARSQPCVIAHEKAHSLFMWIGVQKDADPRAVACRVANLNARVVAVETPSKPCCGSHEIQAGVGFGPEFYQLVKGGVPQPFNNSKHSLISSGSVGGDILIHAKSNKLFQLQQLSKSILDDLPADSVLWHEAVFAEHRDPEHGGSANKSGSEPLGIVNYQYTKGKLELFPPSTPPDTTKPGLIFVDESGSQDTELKRHEVAVDPNTGGSYAMTQRWVHDIKLLYINGEDAMNEWVDKAWEESASPPGERKFRAEHGWGAELLEKSMETWMDVAYQECLEMQKKHPCTICTPGTPSPRIPFRILRQSLPYKGGKCGQTGMIFVSYANTPKYNELLLDRLIASASGGGKLNSACRNVFRLSHNVRSACWYFPGVVELRELT